LIRINKYLSMCGVTSRRGAEKIIAKGRVTVNDVVLEKVGTIIDESTDVVKVDGIIVKPVTEKVYIVFNKPRNVMTTLFDPFKRKTVLHLLKGLKHRVYPVGRLDYETEGVLILTNDGDLAYRLTHPKYEIQKIYEALVDGLFQRADGDRIAHGITLEDGAVGKATVRILGYGRDNTRIRLILTEGRKREVRQLCKAVGHPVKKLVRVEVAGITAKGLDRGKWRFLSEGEVEHLKALVGLS